MHYMPGQLQISLKHYPNLLLTDYQQGDQWCFLFITTNQNVNMGRWSVMSLTYRISEKSFVLEPGDIKSKIGVTPLRRAAATREAEVELVCKGNKQHP